MPLCDAFVSLITAVVLNHDGDGYDDQCRAVKDTNTKNNNSVCLDYVLIGTNSIQTRPTHTVDNGFEYHVVLERKVAR